MKELTPYILAFIPVFVAVDCLGTIPIFLSLTEKMPFRQRRMVIFHTVVTATIIAILFMVIGKLILRMIGVTIDDFKIAGGILLLVISINLLLPGKFKGESFLSSKEDDVGVFPLGTPLITGPAVLTTTLIVLDSFGLLATFVSLILNMLIVWVTFIFAHKLMSFMGKGGIRAFSKVAYILLAAIAIMMIRKGVSGMFFLLNV
ncbi:MAG: MarC family protein [Candidatus Omnitrophota bacterium]|nr:MarC family protein [Candidatus Omnitrophota bacterium]